MKKRVVARCQPRQPRAELGTTQQLLRQSDTIFRPYNFRTSQDRIPTIHLPQNLRSVKHKISLGAVQGLQVRYFFLRENILDIIVKNLFLQYCVGSAGERKYWLFSHFRLRRIFFRPFTTCQMIVIYHQNVVFDRKVVFSFLFLSQLL